MTTSSKESNLSVRKILARIPVVNHFVSPIVPTPKDVKDFWAFMTMKYNVQVINKTDSDGMKIVAVLLDLLRIQDKNDFMTRYTTTIGSRIYIPFTIGVSSPPWDLWAQIKVLVHEIIHVQQEQSEGSAVYKWSYITSTAKRTMYEVEAYRTNMEMEWRYMKRLLSPSVLASSLKGYGCSQADVDVATKALGLAVPTIKAGGLTTEVTREAAKWLDERF